MDKMAEGIEWTNGMIIFITKKYSGKVNVDRSDKNCRLSFNKQLEKEQVE